MTNTTASPSVAPDDTAPLYRRKKKSGKETGRATWLWVVAAAVLFSLVSLFFLPTTKPKGERTTATIAVPSVQKTPPLRTPVLVRTPTPAPLDDRPSPQELQARFLKDYLEEADKDREKRIRKIHRKRQTEWE